MRSKDSPSSISASLISALAQRDDCAVDLKQRDRASVAVDGGPILRLDEGDELAGAAQIFEFGHQPLEHSAMHAGERFLELLAMMASPRAQEIGGVRELLVFFAPLHGAPSAAMRSRAAPSGDDAVPLALRRTAPRRVSSEHPCWRAKLAATAASRQLASAWEPALWFERKTSASRPSGNFE